MEVFVFILLGLFIIALIFRCLKIKRQKRILVELQKELHHRISNNLGVISAFINTAVRDRDKIISAKDLESRIESISLIHEQLYQQKDVTKLNLHEFLQKLCDNLIRVYHPNKNTVYDINVPLKIKTKLASPIALVITEIITNSLKHGSLSGIDLKVSIEAKLSTQRIQMTIADNGKGFMQDFNLSNPSSYGIQMIKGLIKQIKGEIKFYNNNGATVQLIF